MILIGTFTQVVSDFKVTLHVFVNYLTMSSQVLKSITLFTLVFASVLSFGQNGRTQNRPNGNGGEPYGIITGVVLDESTGQNVEYANIVLFRTKDSTMVTGTITDGKGKFILNKLNAGKYYLRIQFIGYENREVSDITISPRSADVKLGNISIQPKTSALQGVEITSERSMITTNLDKKVITVDKTMALGGGTATDIMENVPSVEVDAEGNVSLRGNSNITLLVDGKPASQAGLAASDLLNQIPASAIESVEVITNPSVRYDPDGTSGIINIVLKKKTLQGFNGMVSANAGTGDKYNGSVVLNYRHDKFNASLNFDGRKNNMNRSSISTRTSNYGDFINVLNQNNTGNMSRNMSNISAGFDYFIDTRNNITLSVAKRDMNFGMEGDLFNRSVSNNEVDRLFNRSSIDDRAIDSWSYTLSYKHLYPEKGREFTNDIIFLDNAMNSDSRITQQNYDIFNPENITSTSDQWNISKNDNKMITVQGNYVYPMATGSRIEAGYKASILDMGTEYDYQNLIGDEWLSQENLLNKYDYNEQIYAVYGIYANSWKKFRYQAGLRFEQVFTESNVGVNSVKLTTQYSSFYPSFHTQYDIADKKELQLSYSRRVRRPSPHDMNPYVDYADSLNLRTGNPEIRPEFTNSVELGLLQYFNTGSLTTTLFYRYTNDEVEMITQLIDTINGQGVTLSTPYNISKETNYGLEVVGTLNPAKWMRINGNVSFYRALMAEVPEYNIEGTDRFTWRARLNMTFMPWKDGSFQLIGNYHSPRRSVQDYRDARYYADIAFRQDLLDKRLSISLRLTDIFKSSRFNGSTYGEGFTIDSERNHDSRILFLGISYQFNNFKKKATQDMNQGMEDMEIEGF